MSRIQDTHTQNLPHTLTDIVRHQRNITFTGPGCGIYKFSYIHIKQMEKSTKTALWCMCLSFHRRQYLKKTWYTDFNGDHEQRHPWFECGLISLLSVVE